MKRKLHKLYAAFLTLLSANCFHHAAENGNIKAITELVKSRADVNTLDNDGNTPLHAAAMKGQTAVVKALLSNDATVDTRNVQGNTPLHLATKNGHKAIAILLLRHKADKNAMNKQGNAPLHIAIEEDQADIAILLIGKGADKNITNNKGEKPIHIAATKGSELLVDLLIQDNMDSLKQANYKGEKPYTLALNHNHPELGKTLKDYTDLVTDLDEEQNTRLHKQVCNNTNKQDLQTIEELAKKYPYLLSEKNRHGKTPLHLAVEIGINDVALSLLNLQANIEEKITPESKPTDQKDYSGYTPLQVATQEGNPEMVGTLIQQKADVTKKVNGLTPLHLAVKNNHNKVVEALLDVEATNVNEVIKNKYTPLHVAIENGNLAIVSLLLHKKADINAVPKSGTRPLTFAVEKSQSDNLLKLLLDNTNLEQTSLKEAFDKAPNRRVKEVLQRKLQATSK